MRSVHVVATAAGLWLAALLPALAADCGALANQKLDNVNLLSAVEVPAAGDLPAYCRVLGFVRPATNFEVRLPVEGWNGKFYMTGCGGFCGLLLSDAPGFTNAINYGLRRRYAVATMDGGHWGSSVVDGRWAAGNPVARADWGTRAVTETAKVGKAMVASFYGRPQTKAYFAGCSTGGRMAAMEAWKYPKDFDGIIAGAPALDYTGLVGTFFAWVTKANLGTDGKPILSTAKAKLVGEAAYVACDGQDGAKDGIIADPRQCAFNPAALLCRAGQNSECLTAPEVEVVERWYRGPTDARGRQLYPGGIPVGSEPHWPRWLTGLAPAPALLPLFADGFLRHMAFEALVPASFKVADFDMEHDPARMAEAGKLYNSATFDPDHPAEIAGADLGTFKAAGGKMILYHGWADPLVTPYLTVAYYEAVAKAAGGVPAAQDFARLFMVPGMDHCGIGQDGPGIADTGIDPLTALEAWVEEGRAPATITASKVVSGETRWARPLCPYPAMARYDGRGPLTEAASFSCATP